MNINAPKAHLTDTFQCLKQRWLNSGDVWNDKVRQEFESVYWHTIESETRATIMEMEKLAHIIAQAHRNVR